MNVEGYYKSSSGFSRYFLSRIAMTAFNQGEAQAIGLDIFVRKRFQVHEFWISYSIGQVRERFGNQRITGPYRLAPQSQRHEVKAAAIFTFNRVQFSATSVYGSGFPNSTIQPSQREIIPYYRTDLAVQYEFSANHVHFETGLSILNLFNRKNVRLNQSVNVPDGAVINTLGIPFTPTVYVNVSF